MKRIQVLDRGWVQLEDCTGGDAVGIELVLWNRVGADSTSTTSAPR